MTENTREKDVAFIRALAELLRETELSELEVKREYGEADRLNVRVARQMAAPAAPVSVSMPAAMPAPVPATPAAPSAPAPEDPAQHAGAVTSPMVGTVYLQPEPGSKSFVSVGDKVSEGQTLLIIEAMKTMNQIPSPRAGTVKRILVEDKSAVEYGAPLMIIE
ncbi:acetyl-CoA carboxylase biotin carboxyl carrier protein [Roseibacterium sp. SDUM158016]|uniref:acetyl-CoA carboxylase biotin carboxyl carrier protein n=1 Tax=Roseicyclus sediminis TaxID=2980997 RepID=UPI0021CF3CA6|nr:acetyl-CoA carboxylase biotin carboxyl carrier protein [Roseibacterium sp. SDUM158016]MCU4653775.1 acetyl-CoA carboxylase biotin carboxyl carrier protein [Roseibacterium sp. SDUM158016]